MEKIAFFQVVLLACLGLVLFGSNLLRAEQRFLRILKPRKGAETVDLDEVRTHHG